MARWRRRTSQRGGGGDLCTTFYNCTFSFEIILVNLRSFSYYSRTDTSSHRRRCNWNKIKWWSLCEVQYSNGERCLFIFSNEHYYHHKYKHRRISCLRGPPFDTTKSFLKKKNTSQRDLPKNWEISFTKPLCVNWTNWKISLIFLEDYSRPLRDFWRQNVLILPTITIYSNLCFSGSIVLENPFETDTRVLLVKLKLTKTT